MRGNVRNKVNRIGCIGVPLLVVAVGWYLLCPSESYKEATALFESSEVQFQKGNYDKAISGITGALELRRGDKPALSGYTPFSTGEVHLLRAKAYERTGRLREAIEDYRTATTKGTEYLSSYVLNSDPSPGAKADWFRVLSGFYNSLGIACAKDKKYEDALEAFEGAIGAAGGSTDRVGVTDQLVGNLFGGEQSKQETFSKAIGAYCYNVGVMEDKLARSSKAKDIAKQLGYDRSLVVELK